MTLNQALDGMPFVFVFVFVFFVFVFDFRLSTSPLGNISAPINMQERMHLT
jgi:hypothetical protein